MRKSINIIRLILGIGLISSGVIFLVLSYLCFENIIEIEEYEYCGSACGYFWSWLINFPPIEACIAMCFPRNELHKPFLIVGGLFILTEICLETIIIFKKNLSKKKEKR